MTRWPSDIPLLLSAFRAVDGGVIAQRDVTVGRRAAPRRARPAPPPSPRAPLRSLSVQQGRAPSKHAARTPPSPQFRTGNVAQLVEALNRLPGGGKPKAGVPQLRPKYANGRAPSPDAKAFVIKSWVVRMPRGPRSKTVCSASQGRRGPRRRRTLRASPGARARPRARADALPKRPTLRRSSIRRAGRRSRAAPAMRRAPRRRGCLRT
jgi:hypothetical protein